jgi:hypothetical protein
MLLLENPPALSNCGCLGPARRIQLVQNGFDMRFHGPDRHIQLYSNVLVAAPEHHVSQYVSLPARQGPVRHPLRNTTGDQRAYGQATGAHRA